MQSLTHPAPHAETKWKIEQTRSTLGSAVKCVGKEHNPSPLLSSAHGGCLKASWSFFKQGGEYEPLSEVSVVDVHSVFKSIFRCHLLDPESSPSARQRQPWKALPNPINYLASKGKT